MTKKVREKNYKDIMNFKRELELKAYQERRTGCCPLCKKETSEEIESYVRKEIAKVARDPTYIPKVYGEEKIG